MLAYGDDASYQYETPKYGKFFTPIEKLQGVICARLTPRFANAAVLCYRIREVHRAADWLTPNKASPFKRTLQMNEKRNWHSIKSPLALDRVKGKNQGASTMYITQPKSCSIRTIEDRHGNGKWRAPHSGGS